VSVANLGELRLKVEVAYGNLVRKLLNHPHLRMTKLQGVLTKFQNDLNAGAAVANDFILCLQTICDTIGAVGTAFQNITQADIQKEIANYTKNYIENAGEILDRPDEGQGHAGARHDSRDQRFVYGDRLRRDGSRGWRCRHTDT
jgi:hypothetical protein